MPTARNLTWLQMIWWLCTTDWLNVIFVSFISINEVRTIQFSRQVVAKRLCKVAGDIPRQLIKMKYLSTKVYLATDVSFSVLSTAFICYESVVYY